MGIAVTLCIGNVTSSISYIFADDDKEDEIEELEEQDEKSHELEAKEWDKNNNKLIQPEQQKIIPEASAQQPKQTTVGSPAPDQQQLVKQLEAEKQKLIQELEQRKQQQQIQEQILNQN